MKNTGSSSSKCHYLVVMIFIGISFRLFRLRWQIWGGSDRDVIDIVYGPTNQNGAGIDL